MTDDFLLQVLEALRRSNAPKNPQLIILIDQYRADPNETNANRIRKEIQNGTIRFLSH